MISYGARILRDLGSDAIEGIGLAPGGYHLVVARFEPENHVDVIVEGYRRSNATLPLVVVGSAPYAAGYTDGIAGIAEADSRIRLLGGVWDQRLLDQLYAHALSYVHGHSVGGTNPSLLRAMGAGTAVIGWDVVFNHEVAGPGGPLLPVPVRAGRTRPGGRAPSDPVPGHRRVDAGASARPLRLGPRQRRLRGLAAKLVLGYSSRGTSSGRRAHSAWSTAAVPVEVDSS